MAKRISREQYARQSWEKFQGGHDYAAGLGPEEARSRANDAFWARNPELHEGQFTNLLGRSEWSPHPDATPPAVWENHLGLRDIQAKFPGPGHAEQGHLFNPDEHLSEPHQVLRHQFAADPRTWWHGRYGEGLPRVGSFQAGGIHVGSEKAAADRQEGLGPFRETMSRPYRDYRMFPVRLHGRTWNDPSAPAPDEGNEWMPPVATKYYRNRAEDYGSVSAILPHRAAMKSHPELIAEAKARGEKVPEHVEWERKAIGKAYAPGVEGAVDREDRDVEENYSWFHKRRGQLSMLPDSAGSGPPRTGRFGTLESEHIDELAKRKGISYLEAQAHARGVPYINWSQFKNI